MNTVNSPSMVIASLLETTQHCSRYVRQILATDQTLLAWLRENYSTPCNRTEIHSLLKQSGLDLGVESQLAQAVRKLRKQVMIKLILRDLNGLADLNEVMSTMTALAEICLQHGQACLMQTLKQQFGSPIGESSGTTQEMLIVGMGKLGGGELNVSSDIDLIFVYPEDGQTNGTQGLSNHEFFSRLGRHLINLINELTADGYVFRVDMRLRPYGDSGSLVMSFAALEEYLVSQGREWERYAWIKARVVSPQENPQSTVLMQLVQPFVFRKYLDFGAIDSMRKLHAQIRQEVLRRDRLNNIKLGPGGIREIEFTAQVFQLIRGGQDAQLRILPTRAVLQVLSANGQLGPQLVADLDAAYVFLRNLEHRLQYLDDQQTQELPEKQEDQQVIAKAMGYTEYAAMLMELDRHRQLVNLQFEQIFGAQPEGPNCDQLWGEEIIASELISELGRLGYRAAPDSAQRLMQFRDSSRYRQLPELSKQRLDKVIPRFITLSANHEDPDATLSRLLTLLEAISRRAAYLAFLAE
jgi:glutamate-ammonia-ligase adenylyltransferase